jgi:hypothetical protein
VEQEVSKMEPLTVSEWIFLGIAAAAWIFMLADVWLRTR